MPIYEYLCEKCKETAERFQKIGDTDAPDCPKCGNATHRILSFVRVNMGVGPYGYYDETLQTYVHTNAHRREVMRQQDVTPMGDTPKHGQAWA